MSHLSLYRKYRPQHWGDVLGQDHIVQALQSAVTSGQVSHAYLFAGSRGTGKTSVARIFAKELGTSQNDIYEIDAASNNGVDEIRELTSGVTTLPFDSKYKVYILDEAHMLSKSSFNALLKTLEEPPQHVIFILATTELHKILPTVKSRCQVFEFKKPTTEMLRNMLTNGAKEEGFELEQDVAETLAKHGDGAFRDAWGVLERILQSAKGKKITLGDITSAMSLPHHELVHEFVKNLIEKNLEECILILHTVHDEGHATDHFLENVIHECRLIMLYRFAPKLIETMKGDFSDTTVNDIQKWAGEKNMVNAQLLAEFLGLLDEVKKSSVPYIPIELALMRILGHNPA